MSKRNRILILSQFYHPEYVTASVLIGQMAEDLAAQGFDVEVLCGRPKEYVEGAGKVPGRETHKGVHIRRARYLQLPRKSRLGRLVNYFTFVASVLLRWPTLLGYGLLVVYTNPPLLPMVPALLNRLFGQRFAFVCYDLYPELAIRMGAVGRGSAIDQVMGPINRAVYGNASAIVALGQDMKRYMATSGLAPHPERIEVIPNWYDDATDVYRPMPAAQPAVFTVVYSGNMGVCQDMETILAAARLLQGRADIRFVFTGHGNKADSLKETAGREGLENLSFDGYLTGERFAALLAGASCFLVSLEAGMEGLAVPSKTYSYLAAGRPVLSIMAEDADVSRILVEREAGLAFANGDGQGLADGIAALADDYERCQRMGRNARALFVQEYRRELCTARYGELFARLLGQGDRKGRQSDVQG